MKEEMKGGEIVKTQMLLSQNTLLLAWVYERLNEKGKFTSKAQTAAEGLSA